MSNFQEKANFIWQVADDILFGTFMHNEFRDVVLPFVVMRRLDSILEDSKDSVIKAYKQFKGKLSEEKLSPILLKATKGLKFYNTSDFDLKRLTQDDKNTEINFNHYINGYSENVRDILENFKLKGIIEKLVNNDLLYQLIVKFNEIDLHPEKVTNHEMGQIYEELLRRFDLS